MIVFAQPGGTPAVHQARRDELFLKFLPAVQTHARIQFRHLPAEDREEAIAEAIAAAFLNVHKSTGAGAADRLTPGSVANFAVKHVRSCRHVGTGQERSKDAMSRLAQQRNKFRVLGLSWDSVHGYDAVRDGTTPVWEDRLAGQPKPTPAEQAAFRIDFSQFMRNQSGRTRKALALLAAGHRQVEVAEQMGLTQSAICQRQKAEYVITRLRDRASTLRCGERVDVLFHVNHLTAARLGSWMDALTDGAVAATGQAPVFVVPAGYLTTPDNAVDLSVLADLVSTPTEP